MSNNLTEESAYVHIYLHYFISQKALWSIHTKFFLNLTNPLLPDSFPVPVILSCSVNKPLELIISRGSYSTYYVIEIFFLHHLLTRTGIFHGPPTVTTRLWFKERQNSILFHSDFAKAIVLG